MLPKIIPISLQELPVPPLDFTAILEEIRTNYAKSPCPDEVLPRPYWMKTGDPLAQVFQDKQQLFTSGQICYGCIVQANELMFRLFPQSDHPAQLLYSDSPLVNANPLILGQLSEILFRYKSTPLEQIPIEHREIAQQIKNEMDRSSFTLDVTLPDRQVITVHSVALMLFRKHLPGRRLRSSFLPILAKPYALNSVLVVPGRYWSTHFKQLFLS